MAEPPDFPLRGVLEAVVRAAHRGILHREVDPAWLGPFTDELMRRAEAQPLAEVAAHFIRVIHESPEAQNRALGTLQNRALEPLLAPLAAGRPAPLLCVSAGCGAATAGMLRRAGLRRWAGPFDWMELPPAAVLACLTDDFTALLQPRYHEPIPPTERPPGAAGYFARHTRLASPGGEVIFHRADPTTPDGFAALERAVLRLRESLRGLHGKLLLQVAAEQPDTAAIFAETADILDRTARGAALTVISLLEGKPEGPFPEMELAEARGAHRWLRARTLSTATNGAFADPLDEVVLLRGALATSLAPLD